MAVIESVAFQPSSIIFHYVSQLVASKYLVLQWNSSIAATLGKWYFGCYTEVAVVEGFYTEVKLNWDQGYWPLYSRWLLLRGGC